MSLDEELLMCAQSNFENLEKAAPIVSKHPFYRIAKAQLDEALGGMPVEEVFALDTKRAEKQMRDEE